MQTARSFPVGVARYAFAHKITSAIIAVVVVGGGYWTYQKLHPATTQTHYILGTVATGTIIASLSESGQVSSSNSIDIKPQVTGTITWVGAKAGDYVRAGQAIASIDDTDAVQAVSDAKKTLAADQLQFQKDTAQAPISYQNDQAALVTAQENLHDDYNTAYNDLTDTYLDFPAVMSAAQDALYGYDFDSKKSQWNVDVLFNLFTTQDTTNVKTFMTAAESDYTTATDAYQTALDAYKTTSRAASSTQIDSLLSQSVTMTTAVAQALQSELNFLGAVSDLAQTYNLHLPSSFSTVQSSTRSNLSTANSDLSTLLADQKTLKNAAQAITTAQQNLTLDQVGNPDGSNPISLQISANSLAKEAADLATQEANLADYTIVAPFSGTLSAVDVKVGDSAGSSAVATIISTSQIATLSVNEVDAAKIHLGDKATLTFDAIDGLTLTGTVAEIDPAGTVSQGVVSYNLQISFDTQDTRVKSGMTVNADIQTAVHQNVLVVPSAAVKTTSGISYVQVFVPALTETGGTTGVTSAVAPQQVEVTTGISDDTNIEILSGLTAGEQIVTKTTTGSATKTTTTTTSGGGPGGGGAAIRL